jgi:hypothetical protein
MNCLKREGKKKVNPQNLYEVVQVQLMTFSESLSISDHSKRERTAGHSGEN